MIKIDGQLIDQVSEWEVMGWWFSPVEFSRSASLRLTYKHCVIKISNMVLKALVPHVFSAVSLDACVPDKIASFMEEMKHLPPPVPKASDSELGETWINEFFA